MPYVHSHGVRIHYQTAGDGPPLLLQHGFTDSLESWYECGYIPALLQHYRLILLDARGHGGSEKPHEPAAYEPQLFVADILAVLDHLHIPKAPLWEVPLSPALQTRLLTNDMEAIVAYWRQRMESPGFEEVLPTLPMPCLFYAGEADGRYANAKGCVTHMPNATFFSLPGLKHAEGFFRSDLVLPHVMRFLATRYLYEG